MQEISSIQWGIAPVKGEEGGRTELLTLYVNDDVLWVGPGEMALPMAVALVELLIDVGVEGAVEQFPMLTYLRELEAL